MEFNHYIAKFLFVIGIRPKVTTFIDGESLSYGYGKLDGWTGTWQYQLHLQREEND